MIRRSRFVSGIALTVILAACGSGADPVGPDAGPSYTGGLVTGSNRSDSTTTTTTTPTDSTTQRSGGLVTGSN